MTLPHPTLPAGACAEVRGLSPRVADLCTDIAGGDHWTFDTLHQAAQAFELGSAAFGLKRSYPKLATSLRRLSARWWVRAQGAA